MLGLGGVELTHWMSLRQVLSLALMDAARVGATRQARPAAIATAFEQGLRMAYPGAEAATWALRQRRQALGLPWHIGIRQPAPAAFLDHADATLSAPRDAPEQASIRNDYQALQHARRLAQGWPQGRGPRSGHTIYEANTLTMDLLWPHRPMLPGLSALIRALASLSADAAQARIMAAGYLPFRRRVIVTMQSDPSAWPPLPDGRITYEAAPAGAFARSHRGNGPAGSGPQAAPGHADASAPGPAAEDLPPARAADQPGPTRADATPYDDAEAAPHDEAAAAPHDDTIADNPQPPGSPDLPAEDPDGLMCEPDA